MATKSKPVLEAEVIAHHFGFGSCKVESVTKEDIRITEGVRRDKGYLDENLFPIEEVYAQLRQYKEKVGKDDIDPRFCYYEGGASGKHNKHRKSPGSEIINLHILNDEGSIAVATLIKTAESILAEHGIKKIKVLLNNVGDKDNQLAYTKEATSYYRKKINELNSNARQLFKESLHALVTRGKNHNSEIHEEAPKPMEFMNEPSRKKFGEVLEFVETMGIPYEIDQHILGDPNYSTNTVFQIVDEGSGKVVAAGSRYDALARRGGLKKDIPGAGVTINVPNPKKGTAKALKAVSSSNLYFLQIGYVAKLKSLVIIDDLRKAGLPVKHKLYRDRLTSQISSAKKEGSDYLIIVGQKEAMDDNVIVRDKDSRSQHIVMDSDLISYLKKLK